MAKRRKTRTHNIKADAAKKPNDGTPKSFVIHAGEVGNSVKELSKDIRRVLEPNTASRLRERKSNKIKDFVAMSGPLGVTHMVVLAQSTANKSAAKDDKEDPSSNVNLRITRLPRGPTLGFKILRYALVRDILAATKRPRSPGKEFATEPILILNNFSATSNTNDARQLTLLQTMFQNLFPPIKVHTMPLSSARRVVLLSYNATTRTIDFRHYLITVRPVGVSRSIRKIIDGTSAARGRRANSVYSAAASDVSSQASFAALRAKGLPNLSNAKDISDFILNHGDMGFLSSASEAESDASGAEDEPSDPRQVELTGAYIGRANKRMTASGVEKRAVRLTELGPRMELGLVKIENGIGDGKGEVLFHEFIHKTPKEAAEIARRAKEREKLAKLRREQQEANVKRKQEEKEAKKREKAAKRGGNVEGASAHDEDSQGEETDDDEEQTAEEADEFEYEDMYGDDGEIRGAGDEDGEDDMFEQASEGEEEEDEDSDLEPIPIEKAEEIGSSDGERSEDDDDQRRPPAKRGKMASTKPGRGSKPKFSMKIGAGQSPRRGKGRR